MAATLDIARAARQAALRVEQMLVEMLTANELGDVSIEVGYADLTPIKRVQQRAKVIKVSRGQATPVELIEA